jgi:uncharacterized protein YjbI with pentapeptide repeats
MRFSDLLDKGGKVFFWLLWDFTGVRFIYRKLIPYKDNENVGRRPSTFLIWCIGIYVALFGVASQRYESALSKIDNKVNLTTALVSGNQYKAMNNIPHIQSILLPIKPELFDFQSVFYSLFGNKVSERASVKFLAKLIEDNCGQLDECDLTKVNLLGAELNFPFAEGTKLYKADLRYAFIKSGYFGNAFLVNSDLSGAFIANTDFRESNLSHANLKDDIIINTNFKNAVLTNTDFKGAIILDSDFSGALNLDSKCLGQALTLYGTKLDDKIKNEILQLKPHLIEENPEKTIMRNSAGRGFPVGAWDYLRPYLP